MKGTESQASLQTASVRPEEALFVQERPEHHRIDIEGNGLSGSAFTVEADRSTKTN